jgi:hypothetical protein
MRSVFLSMLVFLGCGSSTDAGTTSGGAANQADIDASCAQACAAEKKCVSTTDETTCVNKCKNDYASYAGKVRRDYVELQNSCLATASCDKRGDCDDTAKASISPTAAVQTFCDAVIKKNIECKFAATDKSRCLDNFKVFSDAAIDSAATCFTKSCTDYPGCVFSSVGLKF